MRPYLRLRRHGTAHVAVTYIRLRRRECHRARTDPVTGVIRPQANHPATPSASSTPPSSAPPTSTRLTSTQLTSTQRTSTRQIPRLRFRCRHRCRQLRRGWECDALRPRAALTLLAGIPPLLLLAGIPPLRVSLRDTQGTDSLSSTRRISSTSSLTSRPGCPGPARPADSLTGTHASRKGSGTRGLARTTAAVTTSLSLPVLLVPSLPARILWPSRLLARPKKTKDLQAAAGRNGASAASSGARRVG